MTAQWIATAEHTQGQSRSHCCAKGIFSDATDGFEAEVEGNMAEAEAAAWNELDAYCSDDECDCQRHTTNYGGDKWLRGIVMNLEPQNDEARELYRQATE
jgi:hypothetical protein